MTDLTIARGGAVQQYDPVKSSVRIDALDAVRRRAQKIQEWDALVEAVNEQVAEQKEFVAWWDGAVGVRHGGDVKNADRRSCLSKDEAEKETCIKQQQVSKWRRALKNETKYREDLYGPSWKKAMALKADVTRGTTGTGENEWYTPDEYIDMAREVMGAIDLDPASSDTAQQIVKAADYYTAQRDGLLREWHGRVWLNPPYAQPLISDFATKMVEEYRIKHVTEAIMLTHNYTDTSWFHTAAAACDAICFTRGRIKFYDSDGAVAAPTQGQAFFYFGTNKEKFLEIFHQIGFVLNRCEAIL